MDLGLATEKVELLPRPESCDLHSGAEQSEGHMILV